MFSSESAYLVVTEKTHLLSRLASGELWQLAKIGLGVKAALHPVRDMAAVNQTCYAQDEKWRDTFYARKR